jgi:hypothetical protein
MCIFDILNPFFPYGLNFVHYCFTIHRIFQKHNSHTHSKDLMSSFEPQPGRCYTRTALDCPHRQMSCFTKQHLVIWCQDAQMVKCQSCGLNDQRTGVKFPARMNIFLITTMSRPALGPFNLLSNGMRAFNWR